MNIGVQLVTTSTEKKWDNNFIFVLFWNTCKSDCKKFLIFFQKHNVAAETHSEKKIVLYNQN